MNEGVKVRFDEYPANVRIRLEELRDLILSVATELKLGEVTESIK